METVLAQLAPPADPALQQELIAQQQQMISVLKQEIVRLQEEVNALSMDKLNLEQELQSTKKQAQCLAEKVDNVSENNQSLLRTVQVFQREFIKRDSRPPALRNLPTENNCGGQFHLQMVRTLKDHLNNLKPDSPQHSQQRSPFADYYGLYLQDDTLEQNTMNLYNDLLEGKKLRVSKLKSLCKKHFFHQNVRPLFWLNAIENKQQITERLYKALLQEHSWRQENRKQQGSIIELDLRRMDLKLDEDKSRRVGREIKKLLEVFEIYRPDIRYVQGMSYLAWIFLIRLPAYGAFRCFCNLVLGDSFVHCLYTFQQTRIRRIIDYFWECLQDRRPKLHRHMRQLGVDCELFLIEWAYTLYSRTFSLRIVSKIWDSWFSEGFVVFFKVAVSILQILQPTLLQQNECDHFNDTLRNHCFKIEEAEFLRIFSKQKLPDQPKLE